MELTRRRLLIGMAGASLMTTLPALSRVGSDITRRVRYLSASSDHYGRYFLSGMDETGSVLFNLPLPGRGHDVEVDPNGDTAIICARRPGQFLMVIDLNSGDVLQQIDSAKDRHFFGHAVFSQDGRWLYTTENDFINGRGVIGVRDVQSGYRQEGELDSHGIGPHELLLTANGKTLVIANGGVLTHPDTGRAKLNLDTMSPSLTYVDPASGRLLEEYKLPEKWHQNSIRHIAITPNDDVCVAMQYQRAGREGPPLIGMHHKGDEAIQLLSAPSEIQQRMRNYCGSVCTDVSGRWFAVSSPRGGLVTYWSVRDGKYHGSSDVPDGCGLASGSEAGEFYISSGVGDIFRYQVDQAMTTLLVDSSARLVRFDNHMLSVRN